MCIHSHLASVYSLRLNHVWASPWHDESVCNLWPWIPWTPCVSCTPLRLSLRPCSPCDISIADTNPLPPALCPCLHLPTLPVCFEMPPHLWVFCFFASRLNRVQNMPCITQDVNFSSFFFFTSPTVMVTFHSIVLLLFVLFVCQSYACFFESNILYCTCDRVCSGEKKENNRHIIC